MISQFDNLTYLAKNKKMAAKLRLVRFFPKFYKNSKESIRELQFVFHDVKGQRIHGTAPGFLAKKFNDFKLNEGRVYVITSWDLKEDNSSFKLTESSHKLEFGQETKMYEVVENNYPRILFNFKNFKDLSDPQTIDSTKIFDLIGRIALVQSIRTTNSNGVEKKYIDVVLEDVEGCHLTCTLWEEYMQVIVDALNNSPMTNLRVLIVQFCRAKAFDDGSIKAGNIFDATKLTMGDVPEILEFKERYTSHSRPSESTFQYVRPFISSVCEDLESGISPIKCSADFLNADEERHFWIYGNIIDISNNFSFKSCPNCVRKVEAKGDRFWCNYCKDSIPFPILRYKLHISIVDDSAIVPLLCWDKVAREMIGKSCEDVVNEMIKQDDGALLPSEIELLNDKAFMFKVSKKKDQFESYKGPFTVARITNDPVLLNRFGPLTLTSQVENGEVFSPISDAHAEMNSPRRAEDDEGYSPIRAVKTEPYSPNRAVMAEEPYTPNGAVKAEMAEMAEVHSPNRVVKAEMDWPLIAVNGCKGMIKKREQTEVFGEGSRISEEQKGKKKIKIEKL